VAVVVVRLQHRVPFARIALAQAVRCALHNMGALADKSLINSGTRGIPPSNYLALFRVNGTNPTSIVLHQWSSLGRH